MGFPLLNSGSIVMCPHGGMVQHIPTTGTSYRVSGRPPMLLSDVYLIAGCAFYAYSPSPCVKVMWVTGSSLLFVKGQPVLTLASVGMCLAASGAAQGPAIIATAQTGQSEPDEPTFVND